MAAALVLQTQDSYPTGLLGNWALARAIALDVVRADRWRELPDPSEYDFAVALGSDASFAGAWANWVDNEIDWIRDAHAVNLPILGIGFGAQALAIALGGSVTRLASPEFAWIEVETSDAARVSPGPWLTLHGDAIDPPPAADELARSDAGVQAFAIGRHLGVQFHPEATPALLARWARERWEMGAPVPATLPGGHARLRAAVADAVELFDGFATGAGVLLTGALSTRD